MPNAVELIKQAATEAVEAGKPVQLLFGRVISEHPLQIQAEQKAVYTEKMLVLTESVTDYEVDMTVSHQTESASGGAGEAAFAPHTHVYAGRKKVLVHGALHAGDTVLLARMQKGRRFVVLCRVAPNPVLEGEWL